MYEIQTNAKGSRQMFVTDENLKTIERYGLFQQLVDSSGIIDEMVLEKLRRTSNRPSLRVLCIRIRIHR